MSLFGGFQIGPFQANAFQQGNLVIHPGPSEIIFPPNSNQVYEASGYDVTVEYFDVNGGAYIPAGVTWRIWDATNLILIQDWTAITSPTTEDTIAISPADNNLGNPDNITEEREIIFRVVAPGGAVRYDTGIYYVLALPDIP